MSLRDLAFISYASRNTPGVQMRPASIRVRATIHGARNAQLLRLKISEEVDLIEVPKYGV